MYSSLTDSNNADPTIANVTENDSNDVENNYNDNSHIVDAMETEESENCNAHTSTIDMSDENAAFIANDYEFEDAAENTECFEEHRIDAEDLRTLHPNTNCTVLDLHCMIYSILMRHNISWTAVQDLLLLSNHIIGENVLRPSVHLFKKNIRKILNYDAINHFVCQNCELYLGTIEKLNELKIRFCPNCSVEIQTNTKYQKNHFATIPFGNHLQDLLKRNRDHLNFNTNTSSTEICDVHDSLNFRKLREKMGNTPVLTLTFNTDGAARFKSCKDKSVWPIQFVINEIALEHRYKRENTFCAALSFGRTPNMQTFFMPFIQEINKINESGGLKVELRNGVTMKLKIFPMIFTADTPARADVLLKSYFNGYNGCTHCLHSGTLVNKQIRYCKRNDGNARTNEQVRKDMAEAQTTNLKVNGYKGMSPLMAFKYFDLVRQIAPDKMHNIDLGVLPLLFKLILDSSNRKEWFVFFSICEE